MKLLVCPSLAVAFIGCMADEAPTSVCENGTDMSSVPAAYASALAKYSTTNTEYQVVVCTEDADGDDAPDFMVVESTNQPNHESFYYGDGNDLHEDFDFDTNIYKYDDVYEDQQAHSAGNNMIEEQLIVMKMPIAPAEATTKTATTFATIGLALNGVSFFNENAAPGDEITDELFTFDQCSGHPQQQGVYHYHVDPVCLIRDLGGSVVTETIVVDGEPYEWLEDDGSNGNLLLGFLMDGFPVYGPVGDQETDCDGNAVSPDTIDEYNGHVHCTADFADDVFHYHVRTGEHGASGTHVFWITDEVYFGDPGEVLQ
jgi:hypothetical protein